VIRSPFAARERDALLTQVVPGRPELADLAYPHLPHQGDLCCRPSGACASGRRGERPVGSTRGPEARWQRAGDLSLAQIAGAVGYGSPFAFAAAFRRHHGDPPGAWRQRERAAPDTRTLTTHPGS
jgi:AraC-like DNA-binding protein